MRALGPLSSFLLLLTLASPLTSQETGGSTLSGIYSDAQARDGRSLYYRACADCHELGDFTSGDFMGDYIGGTVYDLYQYLVESMPDDAPGSRSKVEYANAVAFILQLNRFPTGNSDLPADPALLKTIKFEAPAKPGGGSRH